MTLLRSQMYNNEHLNLRRPSYDDQKLADMPFQLVADLDPFMQDMAKMQEGRYKTIEKSFDSLSGVLNTTEMNAAKSLQYHVGGVELLENIAMRARLRKELMNKMHKALKSDPVKTWTWK